MFCSFWIDIYRLNKIKYKTSRRTNPFLHKSCLKAVLFCMIIWFCLIGLTLKSVLNEIQTVLLRFDITNRLFWRNEMEIHHKPIFAHKILSAWSSIDLIGICFKLDLNKLSNLTFSFLSWLEAWIYKFTTHKPIFFGFWFQLFHP